MNTYSMYEIVIILLSGVLGGVLASGIMCAITRGSFKSWATGRSKCDYCEKELGAGDLVPALSYVITSGRCKYCNHPLDYKYFLIDLCGIIAGLSGAHYIVRLGLSPRSAMILGGVLLGFLAIAICDALLAEVPFTAAIAVLALSIALNAGTQAIQIICIVDMCVGVLFVAVKVMLAAFREENVMQTVMYGGGLSLADMLLVLILINTFGIQQFLGIIFMALFAKLLTTMYAKAMFIVDPYENQSIISIYLCMGVLATIGL